tara:strand:- start:247 stop:387 length:141 start_codon:yes stop_codon:yes gene_type:complete
MMTQVSSIAQSGKMKDVMRTSKLFRQAVLFSWFACFFAVAPPVFSQ